MGRHAGDVAVLDKPRGKASATFDRVQGRPKPVILGITVLIVEQFLKQLIVSTGLGSLDDPNCCFCRSVPVTKLYAPDNALNFRIPHK